MFLARHQTINLNSGKSIQTPLLVPSFSSRGFEFLKTKDEDTGGDSWESEATRILELTAPHLNDSMLVSAYDIHHKHLGNISHHLTIPELVIIDSGGYECGKDYDLSELYEHPYKAKDWTYETYNSVLNTFQDPLNVIAIVSYDLETSGTPIKHQIEGARSFFHKWPQYMHVVLLKPSSPRARFLNVDEIRAEAPSLRGIDVIGVTEKELGNSILERMKSIARIRLALDEAAIQSPIHVFGALDPLLTPLYFLAGGEIFDGLSWLRYAYHQGLSIYFQDFGVLDPGINRRTDQVRTQMLINNLNHLATLRMQMHTFIKTKDFSSFKGSYSDRLKEWYSNLLGQLPGGR
jgi:hypothetical protein